MENVDNFFQTFNQVLGEDLLTYFGKFYNYLSDLFVEAYIKLENKTKNDDFITYKKNIESIFEVISLGLRTVGVSRDEITSFKNDFLNSIKDKYENIEKYSQIVDLILKPIIEASLIEIIIQYLISEDKTQLLNLNVFNLLPRGFIEKVENFKESYVSPPILVFLKGDKIKKEPSPIPVEIEKIPTRFIKPAEKAIMDLLEKLKQQRIDSEKILEKKIPIENKDEAVEILKKIRRIRDEDLSLIEPTEAKQSIEEIKIKESVDIRSEIFIEFFGNFPQLSPIVRNNIKINNENLQQYNFKEFQDLETFYYFICSLKMMGLDFPYSRDEIVNRLQNFISNKIFCAGIDSVPDPLNVFFGTAIFSEFSLLSHKSIDIGKIKNFIYGELSDFNPWKLHLNTYSLLTLKVLEKNGVSSQKFSQLESNLLKYDIKTAEDYYPNIDLFDKILSLKLLNNFGDLSDFSQEFLRQLKQNITINGSISYNLTDTAKFLLMASLLNLNNEIKEEINQMKNYIQNGTTLFNNPKDLKNLNWNLDNLGFKIEIRMLYWILLALSQFPNP